MFRQPISDSDYPKLKHRIYSALDNLDNKSDDISIKETTKIIMMAYDEGFPREEDRFELGSHRNYKMAMTTPAAKDIRTEFGKIKTEKANNLLHDSLKNINLTDDKLVQSALEKIAFALQDGADVNSDMIFYVKGHKHTGTILHAAASLMADIVALESQPANAKKATDYLKKILLLLYTETVNPNKKTSDGRSLLDFLLPEIDPAGIYSPKNTDPHFECIDLLFRQPRSAYEVDDKEINKVKTAYTNIQNHEKLIGLIERVQFVKEMHRSVIDPLLKEHYRLEGKCVTKKPVVDGRKDALGSIIEKLQLITHQSTQGYVNKEERNANLLKVANEDLKSKDLDKYKDFQLIKRRVINAILTIVSGLILGFIKYACTGTFFLSNKGKTQNSAEIVSAKIKKIAVY